MGRKEIIYRPVNKNFKSGQMDETIELINTGQNQIYNLLRYYEIYNYVKKFKLSKQLYFSIKTKCSAIFFTVLKNFVV